MFVYMTVFDFHMSKNKKGLYFAVVILIGCLIGLFGYFGYRSFFNQPHETQTEDTLLPNQELAPPAVDENSRTTADGAVHLFMDAFMASTPSESDNNTSHEAQIYISIETLQEVQTEDGQYRLPELVGVQDMPDLGYQMGEVTYESDPETGVEETVARVPVIFNYSDGPITKVFILSKAGEQWQITDVLQE
jgi:hypothetical protein